MITEEDVNLYLEHFGVKGQKWGVRKARTDKGSESATEKSARRKQTAKKVAIGAGVVGAGALVAAVMLKRNQNMKMAQIRKVRSNTEATKRLFEAKKGIQINEINRLFREGKITREQGFKLGDRFEKQSSSSIKKSLNRRSLTNPGAVTLMKAKHARLNVSANKDLKSWYERSQTPLHLREYLPVP